MKQRYIYKLFPYASAPCCFGIQTSSKLLLAGLFAFISSGNFLEATDMEDSFQRMSNSVKDSIKRGEESLKFAISNNEEHIRVEAIHAQLDLVRFLGENIRGVDFDSETIVEDIKNSYLQQSDFKALWTSPDYHFIPMETFIGSLVMLGFPERTDLLRYQTIRYPFFSLFRVISHEDNSREFFEITMDLRRSQLDDWLQKIFDSAEVPNGLINNPVLLGTLAQEINWLLNGGNCESLHYLATFSEWRKTSSYGERLAELRLR